MRPIEFEEVDAPAVNPVPCRQPSQLEAAGDVLGRRENLVVLGCHDAIVVDPQRLGEAPQRIHGPLLTHSVHNDDSRSLHGALHEVVGDHRGNVCNLKCAFAQCPPQTRRVAKSKLISCRANPI
jgi:hypothetical protein